MPSRWALDVPGRQHCEHLPAHQISHHPTHTCRAGQGGKQSAKDASGKYARSAGSRLRRYNEAALQRDVAGERHWAGGGLACVGCRAGHQPCAGCALCDGLARAGCHNLQTACAARRRASSPLAAACAHMQRRLRAGRSCWPAATLCLCTRPLPTGEAEEKRGWVGTLWAAETARVLVLRRPCSALVSDTVMAVEEYTLPPTLLTGSSCLAASSPCWIGTTRASGGSCCWPGSTHLLLQAAKAACAASTCVQASWAWNAHACYHASQIDTSLLSLLLPLQARAVYNAAAHL